MDLSNVSEIRIDQQRYFAHRTCIREILQLSDHAILACQRGLS